MITKPYEKKAGDPDPRQRAGDDAERQMAHYLHRAFRQDPEVHVLHDLRLEDREQPEQDGSPGVCQIDHLIVHRFGMFIIESKSVTEEVRVRSDGSGGDEWSRLYQGKEKGMASPIEQARRQSDFLRTVLQRHREELLGREPIGLRTIAKVARGTDQRGFMHVPIQIVVAISDSGNIKRDKSWQARDKPFEDFVEKADQVPKIIHQEVERHRKSASPLSLKLNPMDKYGLWIMEAQEAAGVAEFLAAQHAGQSSTSSVRSNRTAPNHSLRRSRDTSSPAKLDVRSRNSAVDTVDAACKHCGAKDLTARWGRYGYHWRCGMCGKNTKIPEVCSACGTRGQRGTGVRIRKKGANYFRDCEACGASERIWTEDRTPRLASRTVPPP